MKTGFSLLEILHRENPVFITGMGLQCIIYHASKKGFSTNICLRNKGSLKILIDSTFILNEK